ncbi:MAG: 1-acyl-sn-glycerol-3-phosphate acyltransferase [Rickettsiales bacterium]|nr:1-acyl-sn-glycerol-3-phosphate acyltransferase [Rickettsiales bacterium]
MTLRSSFFYLIVYLWTIIYFIVFAPVKLFTRNLAVKLSVVWTGSIIYLARIILGIKYRIEGFENIPKTGNFLVASNHQSAWETFFFVYLFGDPVFILKDDLRRIPVLSNYFEKLGYIYIDRKQGFSALKKVINSISYMIKKKIRIFIIFPQGTRVAPYQKIKLNSGVAAIHKLLKIPVLPIKHNSGLYWKNKKFKKEKGTIIVKIFPLLKNKNSKEELLKKIEEYF